MAVLKTRLVRSLGVIGSIFLLCVSTVNAGCSGDIKASSQSELDSIRSCQTYNGNIVVDNTNAIDLTFNGLETVIGDVIISGNNDLLRLSLSSLQSVNGQFQLLNNKLLSSIDLNRLTSVRSFTVSVHPALNTLAFSSGLESADSFTVTDTTVTRIDGLKMSSVNDLVVSNNIYLKNLVLSNMTQLVGSITMSANSPSLSLDLSSLMKMKKGSFRNVAAVAFNNLDSISGDIFFISNSFTNLSLPKITNIEGTLTITENSQLSTLSMPELTHLGGALSVGGNGHLSIVDAFPKLQEVDGTLDLTGAFDEVMLPELADVRGGLNIQTSSSRFSCEDIKKLRTEVIKGNSFVCKSAVSKPKSGVLGGSGGYDDSGSSVSAKAGWTSLLAFGLFSYYSYYA